MLGSIPVEILEKNNRIDCMQGAVVSFLVLNPPDDKTKNITLGIKLIRRDSRLRHHQNKDIYRMIRICFYQFATIGRHLFTIAHLEKGSTYF
jgi:hypothetical protein